MKSIRVLAVLACVCSLVAGPALAAEKSEKADKKLTCCQAAAAKDKECTHKCCVAAHRSGKSCEKCNPNKEDLNLKKDKKEAKQGK